ncbi:hypothetical protein DPMN_062463 [Dreissena polymorpha]|uniref:Uncharacterized protein n=1 Tax=Dreissena polymorpha TaxID=45954 RepID=A0A9D4HI60_DREPO|nr:hypothetical protein DPMN_062463 [Dreissena polymorpha]
MVLTLIARSETSTNVYGHITLNATGSRPTTAVKQRRARPVLGWVTAWEYRVP